MKYIISLITILSFILAGCSDKDEPQIKEDSLIGYWALSNEKHIIHRDETDKILWEENIIPHTFECNSMGVYLVPGADLADVLIFDKDFVTIRGWSVLPSGPKMSNYDMESREGQEKYFEDFEKYCSSLTLYFDQQGFPVNRYSLHGGELVIGATSIGNIQFNNKDEFSIEYRLHSNTNDEYISYIYTYSRIYSLTYSSPKI